MNLIEIKTKMEELITEREGMIFENYICKMTDDYYPYDEGSFQDLADKFQKLKKIAKDIK